jgi:hypothetical protein
LVISLKLEAMPLSQDQKNAADQVLKGLLEGLGHMPPLPSDFAILNDFGASQGAMNLWVDVAGSDNDPGTQGRPFATIQKALSIAKKVRHAVTINLGAGNFAGFSLSDFDFDFLDATTPSFIYMVGTMVNVTPATSTATGTVTSAVQGDATTCTYALVNDTTKAWTVNDLKEKYFVITGGTGVGQMIPIVSNTGTQLVLCTTFVTTLPDATSTYAIQDCASNINTVIQIPGSAPTGTPSAQACIYVGGNQSKGDRAVLLFKQIKVSPPSVTGVRIGDSNGVAFQNCTFTATGGTTNVGLSGSANANRTTFQDCIFITTGTSNHLSMSSQTGAVCSGTITRCMFRNGFALTLSGFWSLTNSYFTGCSTAIRSTSDLRLYQSGTGIQIDSCTIGITGSLNDVGNGTLQMQLNSTMKISNCPMGINLHSPMSLLVSHSSATSLIGTGNGTAMNLEKGARLQYKAVATLTGTTEIILDGVATNIAAMRAANPKLLTNGYGTIIYE